MWWPHKNHSPLLSEKKSSKDGLKIHQIDKNNFIRANIVSLHLKDLWNHFRQVDEIQKQNGQNKDWNVDLISKAILSNGNLIKILNKLF